MDKDSVAGVVGLQDPHHNNGLGESATIVDPADTAGNPKECRTSMPPKSYAEIRRTLVEGIRKADKPEEVKYAAELLISTIDHIKDRGEDADSQRAFQQNYARLMRVAS